VMVCYHEKVNKLISQALMPLFDRPPTSHKYDFGHVLVIGGAPGMVGAPLLAGRAAMRVGAGLVTIASTESVIDKLEKRVEEIMTLRLSENNDEAIRELGSFITNRKVNVLAIGPGLPAERGSLVKDLVATSKLPVVIDAGGLAAYDGSLSLLRKASRYNPDIILTPHPGEFARLVGKQLPATGAAIKKLLLDTAQATGTVIILKGDSSLVAAKEQVYQNDSGNPGLATAGTGDVLTGMVAGLLAQQFASFDAACCGVYLHGLAGDLATDAKTEPGLIASDVIEHIPAALRQVRREL